MHSDILTFLKSWVAKPLQVAAIATSGRALADLMTRDIGSLTGPVIELGPGTGVLPVPFWHAAWLCKTLR